MSCFITSIKLDALYLFGTKPRRNQVTPECLQTQVVYLKIIFLNNKQEELDKQVAPNLKLEIACNINTSNLSQIQTQLNKMSESLSVNVNTSGIQQSISQAVKAEPVKINVTADVNKNELQRRRKPSKNVLKKRESVLRRNKNFKKKNQN